MHFPSVKLFYFITFSPIIHLTRLCFVKTGKFDHKFDPKKRYKLSTQNAFSVTDARHSCVLIHTRYYYLFVLRPFSSSNCRRRVLDYSWTMFTCIHRTQFRYTDTQIHMYLFHFACLLSLALFVNQFFFVNVLSNRVYVVFVFISLFLFLLRKSKKKTNVQYNFISCVI